MLRGRRYTRLWRMGRRRIGTGAFGSQPILPILRVRRPLLELDAPLGRLRIEKGLRAPLACDATGDDALGFVDHDRNCGTKAPPRIPGRIVKPNELISTSRRSVQGSS